MKDDQEAVFEGDLWSAVGNEDKAERASWALRVLLEGKALRIIRLHDEVTYIGRMAENNVMLDDPQVSRSHARVSHVEDGYLLEDQESENGVFVNGNRVTSHRLRLGDRVMIGSHLLEVIPDETGAQAPTPKVGVEESDAEWRMDQTVQITGEALEQFQKQRGLKKKSSKRAPLPTFDFSLKIGETSYEESVTFDRGRKREEKDGEGNFVEVRIGLGKWILTKKIPI